MDSSLLSFLRMLGHLKKTPRRGWLQRGIPAPESVSDHMYRMAVMCFLDKSNNLDVSKCVSLALVHDIGEAVIGDITPADGVSKDEKYLRERMGLKYLSCLLRPTNPAFADRMMDLWVEFEEGKTPESQHVRQLDALECLIQAEEYEEQTRRRLLDDFSELGPRIVLPDLRALYDNLLDQREAFWSRKDKNFIVILVLGGPGAGKGTQCARLAQDFGFHHISVGDLLRNEARSSISVYADFIDESMRCSVVIPAPLTIHLLEKEMNSASVGGNALFLLDGFPRSMDQALEFEKVYGQAFTLLLDCPEEIMLQRLVKRATTSQRIDDNPDTMRTRLRTFRGSNAQIEAHLRERGYFQMIDCSGTENDVYYHFTKPAVEEIFRMADHVTLAPE